MSHGHTGGHKIIMYKQACKTVCLGFRGLILKYWLWWQLHHFKLYYYTHSSGFIKWVYSIALLISLHIHNKVSLFFSYQMLKLCSESRQLVLPRTSCCTWPNYCNNFPSTPVNKFLILSLLVFPIIFLKNFILLGFCCCFCPSVHASLS
jgi:hypothetical protein